MNYFPQALSEKDIAKILTKLHKIKLVMTELHNRKNVIGYYLKINDFLFGDKAKCEKYYYRDVPKIEARLERMFQNALLELIDIDYMVDTFPSECADRLAEEHFDMAEEAVIRSQF